MRRLTLRIARTARRLAASDAGTMVPFIGAAVPVVAVLLVGASELAMVSADKSKLQDVADAVAMDASQELAFSVDQTVVERAKATAAQHLEALKSDRPQGDIVVTPTIQFNAKGDPEGMHVAIKATRKSFFGNMLPPGGFVTNVETTALRMGKAPLCMLATSATASNTVTSVQMARLDAGKCLVHSNNDMTVTSSNPLVTAAAEAVTSASGNIQPAALVGAEPVVDPFATMTLWKSFSTPGDCLVEEYTYDADGTRNLEPGLHCSQIFVKRNAKLILKPGEHYFGKGGLKVAENAVVEGRDVVLIFSKESTIDFSGAAMVDLDGRRTGAFAGFVMVATRDNFQDFSISAGNVLNLHGTVYVPSAKLRIVGSGKMAEKSAWTVVVGKEVKLEGSANLFINANYRGSPVPVPKGVGNKAVDKTKNARLKR